MAAEEPASPCGGTHESGDQSLRSNVREQGDLLPITNITRIMRKNLPSDVKITKYWKDRMQECFTDLINFITSEANDKCLREKRKRIAGDDVLCAMTTLERFEDYIKPHRLYSQKYKEIEVSAAQTNVHESGDQSLRSNVREQGDLLPITNITRIMRKNLPSDVKITKYGKDRMQECITDLINFITSEANDKCLREKRKRIAGDDVLCAMTTLEWFEDYIKPHRLYSQKYKEIEVSAAQTSVHESGDQSLRSNVREQSDLLPITNITCIMRKNLPSDVKITKYGKDRMHECVTDLINFITSEANDKCLREKRKIIAGDDVLCAMTTLERFEDFIKPHRLYS